MKFYSSLCYNRSKGGYMKKIALTLLICTIFALPSQAKVFKGKAVGLISTTSPTDTISVKSVRNFDMQGIEIKKGYIITGKMTDLVAPQKWHKNASFTFIPQYYTDKDGVKHKIEKEIRATYRQKMKPDFRNSDITFGTFKFSPGYIPDTVKIIHGEGKEVVDDYVNRKTPWGHGTEIKIKPDEKLYFNFPD